MKTTNYLYNFDPSELVSMNYVDAIEFKLIRAKDLIHALVNVHYSERDEERISAIWDAIKFNKKLIEELK